MIDETREIVLEHHGSLMEAEMALLDTPVMFLATAHPERAREFYERVLGLTFVEDSPFALVFRVGTSMLRIQKVDHVPAIPFTLLGWGVKNISQAATDLIKAGVAFERFPGMKQDSQGIWRSPGGALVAWFRDPDGNLLSLSQHA